MTKHLKSSWSLGVLAAAVVAVCASAPAAAQSTVGAPIVKRDAPADMVVRDGKLMQQLPPVSKTEQALAAVTAANASGAQVVTLPYGEHKTYTIPIRPGMFSTFSLPKDEPIQQFAVSDPGAVQLHVNTPTNTAMLKLNVSATVVGTIVTTKHVYYVEISPAGRNDPWYQGVSWSFGLDGFGQSSFNEGVFSATGTPTTAAALAPAVDPVPDPVNDLFSGTPNFGYTIKGSAPFRPIAVWDNGRFTWIQVPTDTQELPALFVDGPNGLSIVNYTVHAGGTQLLVNRLAPSFVLKLGKSSIRIEANR
jgi:type IV secretion system protein VirB9